MRRSRLGGRRFWRLEFLVSGFHFLEDGDVEINLLLQWLVEFVFLVWIEFLNFGFILVLEVNVNVVNSKGSCLSHGVDLLTKDVLRQGRVSFRNVGDQWGLCFAIWPRQGISNHIALAFQVANVRAILADFAELVCLP